MVYSTFLGGSVSDSGNAIALDAENNAIVTGSTSSSDFPTTSGAYSTVASSLFVTKLNSTGSNLVYSTFLGNGIGHAIALDSQGNAYVAGTTSAANFPVTEGAFQTRYPASGTGASSAFVSKLNPQGTALQYSTYLGGSGLPYAGVATCNGDSASGITVDTNGNAYVTGAACSDDFPVTTGSFQTSNHAQPSYSNAFITKLNSAGSAEVYSTYLGGSE